IALFLGIGYPTSVSEGIAILAVASAVDGAGDHANLGYVQISAFGDAVAQRQVGVPTCQISRFPRFDELEREGRWQPGFARLVEMASQEAATPFADRNADGAAERRRGRRANAALSSSSATGINASPAAFRRSPSGSRSNKVGPPKVASKAAKRRPIVGWLRPSARPAARSEPWRATARNTRTSSQSIDAEPFAPAMIRMCIEAHRICRSLILVRITRLSEHGLRKEMPHADPR